MLENGKASGYTFYYKLICPKCIYSKTHTFVKGGSLVKEILQVEKFSNFSE